MTASSIPTCGQHSLCQHDPDRANLPVPKGFVAMDPGPLTCCRRVRDGNVLTPADVAAMWGVAHDKVLEFIKTGELAAFNVASKRSSRPQFRVTLTAVKAFQERRSGRDPARSAPPVTPRRTSSKKPQPSNREYF